MKTDIWDEIELYGVAERMEDEYSDKEKEDIVRKWENRFGKLKHTFFTDEDFLTNFINRVPSEDWEKYIENTLNYNEGYAKKGEYDPKYVIVARRAVPSYEGKPENFWTSNANEVLRGLGYEIREEQRLHSVINISTLDKLIEHGIVSTTRGVSDGEISIDPNKTFSEFLFRYKPMREFVRLYEYLEKGGKSREEVLNELRATATERAIQQGLPIKNDEQFNKKSTHIDKEEKSKFEDDTMWISIEGIEEDTSDQAISDINDETQYLKNIELSKNEQEQENDGWGQEDDWE